MRIAVYHPWIYVKSGLERTLMEIKRRSRHDWVIYTGHYDAEGTYPELKDMGVTELKPVSVRRRYGTVIRAGLTIATTRLDDPDIDLLAVSCDGLGSFINFANRDIPSLCICFTPLRAVYDPEYRRRLLSSNPLVRLVQLAVEKTYRAVDRRAWRYYRQVFCISNEVRERVLQAGLCDPAIIQVAYPGISERDRSVSDTYEPFFFLPGRIMWTKNLELAIEAFRLFKQHDRRGFALKIAGMVDAKSAPYFDRLKTLCGGEPSIEFVLSPSDTEMRELYRRCYAVLFTAFNEDLGITPMEAGAVGKTAIAVNRGGPREIVVHDETGLLVEPEPEAFSGAMRRLADSIDETRRLGLANFERSARYTWDRYVAALDHYVDGIERRGAGRRELAQ